MLNKDKEVFEQALDDLWDEVLLFLKTLGSYDTTLGNEREIQLFIMQYLKEIGLETHSFDINIEDIKKYENYGLSYKPYDDRPVVAGISKGSDPGNGRSLILQAHVDVVAAGPLDHWDTEPFSPAIKNGKMYGRGLLDMKGGLAANIFALKALMKAGIELNGDVLIQTVIEEELTGNGALALLDKGYVADGALIPEPTQLRIMTAQVGVIYMKVTVTGQGAHVEKADQAENAIMKAYKVIQALDEYRDFINNEKKHPSFEDHPHPLNVNIGTIDGGDWTGSVPVVCSFTARVGFYPGTDPKDVQEQVKKWINDSCVGDAWLKDHPPEIEFFGFSAPGYKMDTGSDLYEALSESHQAATGKEIIDLPFTATTDARVFDEFGIPVTCYGPAGDNMHAPNEYIDLESLKDTVRTIAYFIESWCNHKK